MSFLLRLCLGLMVLVPSLAHATFLLENPGNGLSYSGVGVISGWKCEASESLTAHIYDEDMMLAWPDPIPLVYGTERTDVRDFGPYDSADVGFVAIWNWGNLESDGTYTVVVKEDDVELARSTVTVTVLGPESLPQFLAGASGECRVPDFPTPGESTLFEWTTGTQHLEAVSRDPSCIEGLMMESGETCSSAIPLSTPLGDISFSFTFSVENGQGCISGGTPVDGCYPDTDSLPAELDEVDISIMKNPAGSWTIASFPSIALELPTGDLGECEEDLIVGPGAMCSGSINVGGQEVGYTFSVNADGQGCVDLDIRIDLECFDTAEAFENLLSTFQITGPAITDNPDGSWTIDSIPTEL